MIRKYSGIQGLHINSQLLPKDFLTVTRQGIEPKTYRFTPLTLTPSGTIQNFCVESSYIKKPRYDSLTTHLMANLHWEDVITKSNSQLQARLLIDHKKIIFIFIENWGLFYDHWMHLWCLPSNSLRGFRTYEWFFQH